MILQILVTNFLLQTGLSQILPGTIPSLPNPTLDGCLKDAGSANYTSNYTASYAHAIGMWCSMYDEVLPCVDMALPYTRLADVNDWYLSMMYDSDKAHNISEDMCVDWEDYANEMSCIERSMKASTFCIQFQTNHLSTIIAQLYYTNTTDNPYADVNACLYANYTANCMTKHMKHCSEPVRHLVHKYFKVLNGKCDEVLLENAQEHRNKTSPSTEKRQKLAEKMKAIIHDRRQPTNNTEQLQDKFTKLFKEETKPKANEGKTKDNAVGIEIPMYADSKTNSTEIPANSTLTLQNDSALNGNSTRRHKKPKKTRKERVKTELKKLLGFVMNHL